MSKKVYTGREAQEGIMRGVDLIADAVKVTLGPQGKYMGLYRKWGTQHMTKDGVTVAKEIADADPLIDFAVQAVREAASKTADVAGDGTTTSTLLVQAIYKEGNIAMMRGVNRVAVQRGLLKLSELLERHLPTLSQPVKAKDVKQLIRIATISANNDARMGEEVGKVISKIGKDGVVTVEEWQKVGISTEYVSGMEIDSGYISPHFITDQKRLEAVLDNPKVLVTDQKISSIQTIIGVIEEMMRQNMNSLVIVAEDVEADALTNLILNKLNGVFKAVAIKAPAFGERKREFLQDIAALTGAAFLSPELGRSLTEEITLDDLGQVRRFVAKKDTSVFTDGHGDKEVIKSRIEQVKALREQASNDYDRERIDQRIGKLNGGVAVMKVGAATEVEIKEIRDRLDDAIQAAKASLDGGIVAGGGVTYANLAAYLERMPLPLEGDEMYSKMILVEALREPMRQILRNAGLTKADKIVEDSINAGNGIGFNALTIEPEVDMIEAGIIDPAKVVREAISNAISVASQLLATEGVIVDVPEPVKGDQL